MKALVIIPTLNEAVNIEAVIFDILSQKQDLDILIVDGKSNDGTVEIVERIGEQHPNVKLLRQEENSGFGGALKLGFSFALQSDYDPVITMDGDRAHSAKYIREFLSYNSIYSIIVGSRYINGVRVDGWRFRKLLMSKLANMFVSYLLVKPIWDFTSGFRCYSRDFLQTIALEKFHSQAYLIQIELLYLGYKNLFRVKELPFLFQGTKEAPSKVSSHTRAKTFYGLFKFRAPFMEIIRHLVYLKKDYQRFIDEYEELINPPKLKTLGISQKNGRFLISVGVMAYNEEQIIIECLNSLRNQQLSMGEIKEIVVVSSGSTDRTNELVRQLAQDDPRIVLLVQSKRMGKASAINMFMQYAAGDIIVLESGDTITNPTTVEELIRPFMKEEVGMTGSRPIPVNNRKTFIGYCVHRLWELHHQIALQTPKCGEMVAFRNIIARIPKYTSVDEAAIEASISRAKYTLEYCPDAIVHNKGPETLRDFIKQRRRIASGHKHLSATTGYNVSTQKAGHIFKFVLHTQRWNLRETVYMLLLLFIEGYSRMMGIIDFYLRDKNPFIWDVSLTTKRM
jgi:glycosyltransferase involved in cell wall biosynthesis